MGQQQSQNKDELLYQQVNYGNVEGIKALCRDGARLEWIDKEGKTLLIASCLNAELLPVVQTLIQLGANINAYRPGGYAGTPLHHAAKRGLQQTVKLLLSSGANPFVMNDDCQTPLDVARLKGYTNIVRLIEQQIKPFYGWLREIHGPGFLEAFTSQWLSKRIWAAVIPCAPRNPAKPIKLQLAIYPTAQHENDYLETDPDCKYREYTSNWDPIYTHAHTGITLRPSLANELKLFLQHHSLPLGKDYKTGITEMVASVGHSCEKSIDLLSQYMSYKVGGSCPDDWSLAQKLILRGCEPFFVPGPSEVRY